MIIVKLCTGLKYLTTLFFTDDFDDDLFMTLNFAAHFKTKEESLVKRHSEICLVHLSICVRIL